MEFRSMMIAFAPLFSQRVWPQALTLVMGTLMAPGKRAVSQVLRVMGLADEPQFQRYHRVLNRTVWPSRQASHILLSLLVRTFAADGVIVMGLDDTIERRWVKRIRVLGFLMQSFHKPTLKSGIQRKATHNSGMGSAMPSRVNQGQLADSNA